MNPSPNKTDKAVAILYNKEQAAAPQVIASGRGNIAKTIIETAREAGIHIQEDPDLTEILMGIPLGNEIPPDLYQTVAELLAFVYQINDKFKSKLS
ncbi:MAG: flagellar biosynthesis protein FlhB [Proteobacteria bacterium]|nr:MAG: flagellar biosynthesis protein FlhB [Pseudomonadota bacterium]PIE64472.1 MAG: flagellar biosynthesis protein FlhB [Desulfobacterales bacterium]